MSCPRIKLSNSQTLILDGLKTGALLSDFGQQLRRKNAFVPDVYFTLLDAVGISRTLVLNQNAETKKRGSWVPFKLWKTEAAKIVHTERCCLWDCAHLSESYKPIISKVKQFLHSKPSYTKFILAKRKLKKMEAFARFGNEFWCVDLAYIDKLTKDKDGVKHLLVRQDLFDGTVDAKALGMETEDSRKTDGEFLTMIAKKNRPMKIWVDKGTEFAGEFKKFCKARGKQFYSTMNQTKAAFAERTMRSLKYTLYRCMQDDRPKYDHKMSQFVITPISRRNCLIDLIATYIKNSEVVSILYSETLREY